MKLLPFGLFAAPARDPAQAKPLTSDSDGPARLGRQRVLLLAGSVLLLSAPLALLAPAAHWAQDPELFRLLRGMGSLKFVIALLAFAAVWWRLGRTASRVLTSIYVGGVWALALAAGLIWQLTAILPASGLFHLATLALLLAAWRDIEPRFENRRGAAGSE
ncbi:MAG: hypothetical protein ACXIUM_07465 [Wenzhouxiangella sp.]